LQVKETSDSFTSDVNHWTPEVFVMLQSVSSLYCCYILT
jgi:hypothetical protein